MRTLRFATAGSVDDGKSSLIGRLLYDSKSIFEDQLKAIQQASAKRGSEGIELALLTDGLRAEREQNITIDVAYRYFATPKRKFIIADTPGHEEYTRNMVTGASTADLSVVLVDARKGVLPQSKRHAAISALLGIRHIVVAVNKMDLVEFSQARFEEIETQFRQSADRLAIANINFIPISALLGDNVVDRSTNMPWYTGPALLEFLEEVEIEPRGSDEAFRLPVQAVLRPNQDFRGFAGEIRSGSVSRGDSVQVAASGKVGTVASVRTSDGEVESASIGEPVVISFEEEIDVSRGDVLTSTDHKPVMLDHFDATVCWLGNRPLKSGQRYLLLHGTRRIAAYIEHILARTHIEDLTEQPAESFVMNDIGRLRLRTTSPLALDSYHKIPALGSFVLVDESDFVTVGAGMVLDVNQVLTKSDRSQGTILWVTASSEVRQSALAARLAGQNNAVLLEVGDLAQTLNADQPTLEEAQRRIAAIADLLSTQHRSVVISGERPLEATRALLAARPFETVSIGASEGADTFPETIEDAWIVDAVTRRFSGGI